MGWWLWALVMLVGAHVASAAELHLEGELRQGGLVLGQVEPGSGVHLDGRTLRLTEDGWFVFGFGWDAGPTAELVVRYPDGHVERRTLEVEARTYRVQRIDGLPPAKVTPRTAQELARIQADAALIQQARARDSDRNGFMKGAVWPVEGPLSGVFGSQRVLNGEARSPHRGVDIAAPAGATIGAMADGSVSLAETGMYFTGGTVVIDHGHGVHSIYAHMNEVGVVVGEDVRTSQAIGTVGATGRATGPHLHWGAYWFHQALDPALLVGPVSPSG